MLSRFVHIIIKNSKVQCQSINQSGNNVITKHATTGFGIPNLGVLVLAERVEQRGELDGVGLPPDERLHVVERPDGLPRHARGDEPPRQHRERAWRGGAVGCGVDDDPPRGVELARAAERVDDGVVGVGGWPRGGEGRVEARGVEERERELGGAAEAEEELDEEVPREGDAAAGEQLERGLGRVEGVVVRQEQARELVGGGGRGDGREREEVGQGGGLGRERGGAEEADGGGARGGSAAGGDMRRHGGRRRGCDRRVVWGLKLARTMDRHRW